MNKIVARHLLRLGWSVPFARLLAPRRSMILLYHGVPAGNGGALFDGEVFEQHVVFLRRHFEFVFPHEAESRRRRQDKCRVLLTFDDGFRNNAEVVAPILRKYNIPAIFFVCSRHAVPGQYLWFSYLRALERHFKGHGFSFRGELFNTASDQRHRSIQRLWNMLLNLVPHPGAMYKAIEEELPRLEEFVSERDLANCYAGMTVDQTAELAADPLFSVGVHTIDHPFLTKCEPEEAFHQIQGNRAWLEETCGRGCDAIAYPGGDYDAAMLSLCRTLGFARGYCVSRRLNDRPQLELQRIGIYSESTDVLGFKVQWGSLMRAMRIRVG